MIRARAAALLSPRIVSFAAVLAAFTAVFYAGSVSEVQDQEAAEFVEQFNALIAGIDAPGIFFHNSALALPMFIPLAGLAWGLYAAWATGYAVAAIYTTAPQLAQIPPLAILYLSPFGIMELVAYSIALSRSAMLFGAMAGRMPVVRQLVPAAIEVGVVLALLLAGAYVESAMLNLGPGVPQVAGPLS